jgi:predicted permease
LANCVSCRHRKEFRLDLLRLFAENLLPVLLAAAAGYVLAATVRPDPRAVSHVAFSVFAPCLIFQLIMDNHVPVGALLRMFGFAMTALLVLGGIAFGVARALGWSRSLTSALVLTVMLPNAGNLGLSTSLLAFGDAGLAQASLFFLGSSIVTYTLGVFVASLGRAGLGAALLGLVKVPAIWGVALAFIMSGAGRALPGPIATSVKLLADACIPTFLVILGMQLFAARRAGPSKPVAIATGLRLIGGAAVGLLLASVFGLEGAARQAGVLQASMPTAVITIILATEYDIEPEFVTGVVFVSTVLSPFTLTPLMALLLGR